MFLIISNNPNSWNLPLTKEKRLLIEIYLIYDVFALQIGYHLFKKAPENSKLVFYHRSSSSFLPARDHVSIRIPTYKLRSSSTSTDSSDQFSE
jgi:hypothetical protein